ncbi:MAG: class I SAM-dependent methyltransferase, partial [Hyphomicrobiaceae bacterium]
MSGEIDMRLHLATNAARFAWYYGVNQLVDRSARRLGQRPRYRPSRPVPSERELLAELAQLAFKDAQHVRDGTYPAMEGDTGAVIRNVGRVRAMFADLPSAMSRRASHDAGSVRAEAGADEFPDYYTQDFHFQSGGYLSDQSARLYDVQVETLFYGSAQLMRRAALAPVARALAGRDQRKLAVLDVACGTGRLLRELRLAWPALGLTGLDLSQAYLNEARRHLKPLRPARLVAGNAEVLPFGDASQNIVTTVFLHHELPPDVRRRVVAEIARVLKPGGLYVFVDSLKMGDRPEWDGLLEAFPVRFHEPYFRLYAIDDLNGMFTAAGLVP